MRADDDDLVVAADLAFDIHARIECVPLRRGKRVFDEFCGRGVGARSRDVALADAAG